MIIIDNQESIITVHTLVVRKWYPKSSVGLSFPLVLFPTNFIQFPRLLQSKLCGKYSRSIRCHPSVTWKCTNNIFMISLSCAVFELRHTWILLPKQNNSDNSRLNTCPLVNVFYSGWIFRSSNSSLQAFPYKDYIFWIFLRWCHVSLIILHAVGMMVDLFRVLIQDDLLLPVWNCGTWNCGTLTWRFFSVRKSEKNHSEEAITQVLHCTLPLPTWFSGCLTTLTHFFQRYFLGASQQHQ